MNQSPKSRAECKTPLADSLVSLATRISGSFHALPISGGNSIVNSDLSAKYDMLFGVNYLNNERTVTGNNFDSFFFGQRCIKEAENLAADLFNADRTFFVTSGTTVSNQIAIEALYEEGGMILLDKSCHQSMHFSLHRHRAEIDYLKTSTE